jgi:hypothetical protein
LAAARPRVLSGCHGRQPRTRSLSGLRWMDEGGALIVDDQAERSGVFM